MDLSDCYDNNIKGFSPKGGQICDEVLENVRKDSPVTYGSGFDQNSTDKNPLDYDNSRH